MLVTGFPSDAFGTNCYVVATGAGRAVRGGRPGHRGDRPARRGAGRAPAAPGRGAAHPRSPRPHLLGGAGLRRPRHHRLHPPGRPGDARRPGQGLSTDSTPAVRRPAALHRAGRRGRAARRRRDHASPAWRSPSTTRPATPAGRCCSGCRATRRRTGRRRPRACCFSGDVLFAGSIGRTDLPGGDRRQMLASLRDKILPLADDDGRAARPRTGDHDRPGARDQPVPARGGAGRPERADSSRSRTDRPIA